MVPTPINIVAALVLVYAVRIRDVVLFDRHEGLFLRFGYDAVATVGVPEPARRRRASSQAWRTKSTPPEAA